MVVLLTWIVVVGLALVLAGVLTFELVGHVRRLRWSLQAAGTDVGGRLAALARGGQDLRRFRPEQPLGRAGQGLGRFRPEQPRTAAVDTRPPGGVGQDAPGLPRSYHGDDPG